MDSGHLPSKQVRDSLYFQVGDKRRVVQTVEALRCGKTVQMHCQFIAMHCQLHCLYFRVRKQKLYQ